MRIAQISPLIEAVPPKGYGGTERIVSYLTEGLVENGHQVTLFASGDSETKAKLVPVCEKSLRLNNAAADSLIFHLLQIEKAAAMADEFDVLHFHNDYLHFPVSCRSNYTHATTLHGRLDLSGLDLMYREFSKMPLVSISNHQRLPLKTANWTDTIYHGLPVNLYKPNFSQGKYLAFLGRISSEKRVDRAIEIATKAGVKIRIAAKIDRADKEYFETVKHLFDNPLVEFINEIKENEKEDFLGNASALLFPIDWPEPFGLVMIEAMACGTPVIAFNCGSVPEVVDEGITGNIVSSIDEAAKAVNLLHKISRKDCRKKFEERFDVKLMVHNYEKVYSKFIEKKKQFHVL